MTLESFLMQQDIWQGRRTQPRSHVASKIMLDGTIAVMRIHENPREWILIFWWCPTWQRCRWTGSYLFQQALSFEKTPTLCHTVPAFEAFMTSLRDLQLEEDGAEFIISAGIDKLEEYCHLALKTPAYLLSVGEYSFYEVNIS